MAESRLLSRPKPASSFESVGDRFRFTVHLNPDETTIVSWKKLVKDKMPIKTDTPHQLSLPILAPLRKQTEDDANDDAIAKDDEPGPNRLSNVIERIERMYAGNGSSGEEDVVLDNKPDDDEYDTEDSFIDDAELDDYFQVDNSAIKHDGFFVNRGKLERIEPTISTIEQPKKRRRKDMTKVQGGSDEGHVPIKHLKTSNKGKKASSVDRNLGSQLHNVAVPNLHDEVALFQASPKSAPEVSVKKKTADSKVTDQKKTGGPSAKNQNSKKESGQRHDVASQRSNDKSSNLCKSHSGKQLVNANEADQLIQKKENDRLVERFDLNAPPSRDPLPSPRVPLIQRKDGSAVKSKSAMLEKAIRELEKIVAESRPPSAEIQDPDNSSQTVKRRLPSEIKQKLAKVARFAQSSYGKIPMDLVDRLMGIVGHLMQLRTLKKNLKDMANNGLSAKQEKDDQLQKIKQEVAELVNSQVHYVKSKMGPQTANSDDFQGAGPEEKEALKLRYIMDDTLESKICDLYDLYVERLEEHSGPPIRRLYEELAALWPSGVMDIDGIKRAIFRAKGKKKPLGNPQKDQETIKKKKSAKVENISRASSTNTTQAPDINEKLHLNSHNHGTTVASKPAPSAFVLGLTVEKPKHEKAKGNSSSYPVDGSSNDVKQKKKVKRKPIEPQSLLDKIFSDSEERYKAQKHVGVAVTKPALQPGSGNLS